MRWKTAPPPANASSTTDRLRGRESRSAANIACAGASRPECGLPGYGAISAPAAARPARSAAVLPPPPPGLLGLSLAALGQKHLGDVAGHRQPANVVKGDLETRPAR
jgi:hypothetical protein